MAIEYLVVAGWLAQGAVAHVGGAIVEQQLNDLGIQQSLKYRIKDMIEGAVQRICNFIQEQFVQDNINDALADLQDAVNRISLYTASGGHAGGTEDYLVGATSLASSAASHLAHQGLVAFEAYPLAIGVQLNIHEERILKYGNGEKRAVVKLIDDIAMPTVESLKNAWIKRIQDSIRIVHIPRISLPGGGFGGFGGGGIPERWIVSGHGFPGDVAAEFDSEADAQQYEVQITNESEKALSNGPFAQVYSVQQKWVELRNQYA